MNRRLACSIAAVATAIGLFTASALAAGSPSVITGSHTKIKHTSAVLNATVNPNGSKALYFFQWGLTTGYGLNNRPHSAGSGGAPVSVSTTAGGLIPGTVYHYRIVAYNAFGESFGADHTLKTTGPPPPLASTGPAAELGPSFVTLTGVVDPNGATTSYYFQYGLTAAYGSQTFVGSTAGKSPVAVSLPVSGLTPRTIFHYRLIALHAGFPVQAGADQIFMTYPARRGSPRVWARTLPRHPRRRPFVFTTAGSIAVPSWLPGMFGCNGEVKVRMFHGRRVVAATVAAVQPNCTFAVQTVLTRRPGRSRHGSVGLVAFVRFLGNGYVAPARARPEPLAVG